MKEQTWMDPRCDRSQWPAGEWDGEPDKVQWRDAATGLACLAKRSPRMGFWCGYVGVPSTHPLHGKDYDDVDLEVHGGLTFGDHCQAGPPESTICHIPEPGEPDDLYWFGFDCGHAWDHSPFMARMEIDHGEPFIRLIDETYKPLAFVRAECADLAAQLAAVAAGAP